MTHIAIQEKKDGKVVDWLEHVSGRSIFTFLNNETQTSDFRQR